MDLGTVAVLSNPLRYAFDEASKAATQFSRRRPGKPPVAEGDEPGLEARTFTSPSARPSPPACTRSSWRPTRRHGRDQDP